MEGCADEIDLDFALSTAWEACFQRALIRDAAARERRKNEVVASESKSADAQIQDGDKEQQSASEQAEPTTATTSVPPGPDHIKLLQNHCNEVFSNSNKKDDPSTSTVGGSSKGKGTLTVSCEPFTAMDLLRFNWVNFDPLTETYGLSFYFTYLARWPEYFQKVINSNGRIVGYIMGKSEGRDENWHGHVTCLSVDAPFRGQGFAGKLMNYLEEISEIKRTYFVDLFVRKSNVLAIGMYKKLGYVVYRTVLGYYSGSPEQGCKDEDAYDMRKAMSRDVKKLSIIPLEHPVRPEDLD